MTCRPARSNSRIVKCAATAIPNPIVVLPWNGLGSFFFSSRRRHTRSYGDWSSTCALPISLHGREVDEHAAVRDGPAGDGVAAAPDGRSEERRGGKECRSRWWREHLKK